MMLCCVQDAPFFTVKLNVKVLPCLIMFSGGVASDRVAGFDDFGAKDSFSTDSGKADAPHGRLSALHHAFVVKWHQMGSN